MKIINSKIQNIISALTIINDNDSIVILKSLDIFNEIGVNPHELRNASLKITKSNNKFIINLFGLPTAGSYLLYSHDFPRIENNQFIVLHHLFNYFRNNKKYIINLSDEAPNIRYLIRDFFNLCKECKINYKNILFSGNDLFAKKTILQMNQTENTPLFSYFLHWKMINHVGIDSINIADEQFKIKDVKKYKSTCLFGRIDSNRISFVHKLFNIDYFTEDNLYSCFSPPNKEMMNTIKQEFIHISKHHLNISTDLDEIIKKCKIGEFSLNEDFLNPELMRFVPENNNSYLWITAETIPTVHDVMFITEKCLKSYMWYKPIVVYGPPFLLKALKQMGFIDVFELMGFDSSYDLEIDDETRLNKIIEQIDIFNQQSLEDIDLLYKKESVQSALIKNNLHLKRLIGPKKYIDTFENESCTTYPLHVSDTKIDKFIKLNLDTNIDEIKISTEFIDSDIKYFFLK
jgi:hypothetical protein